VPFCLVNYLQVFKRVWHPQEFLNASIPHAQVFLKRRRLELGVVNQFNHFNGLGVGGGTNAANSNCLSREGIDHVYQTVLSALDLGEGLF